MVIRSWGRRNEESGQNAPDRGGGREGGDPLLVGGVEKVVRMLLAGGGREGGDLLLGKEE